MTKRSLSLYTKDILESIEKIEEFIDRMDFDTFFPACPLIYLLSYPLNGEGRDARY